MARLAQRGAAAGRIRDDEVAGIRERGQVETHQPLRLAAQAGVRVQRAATGLRPGHEHLGPGQQQQPHRVLIGARKHDVHHARREQRDAGPGLARRAEPEPVGAALERGPPGQPRRHGLEPTLGARRDRRGQLEPAGRERRQPAPRGQRARQRREWLTLAQAQQVGDRLHQAAMGE